MTTSPKTQLVVVPTPSPLLMPPPSVQPSDGFAEVLARHVMDWHRPDLTETNLWPAITRTAVELIPGANGAAILILSRPGPLTVHAGYGTLPDLLTVGKSAPRHERIPHPAMRNTANPARIRTGRLLDIEDLPTPTRWPVFATPADPTAGRLICSPLGSGTTMFGTLAINIVVDHPSDASLAGRVTAVAMHASTALAAARDRSALRAAMLAMDGRGLVARSVEPAHTGRLSPRR